jgi:hypothetical protein
VNLLKDLPQPSVHRIAVQVTKAGLRAVRQGSPWLYDQAVISHKPHGECGDLAVVFDDERFHTIHHRDGAVGGSKVNAEVDGLP